MPEKGPQKGPCRALRDPIRTLYQPLGSPLEPLWGPPKLGGPVTLLRVLPPVTGPV